MDGCNCNTGLYNLQSADCIKKPGIIRKYVFVETTKADGTRNTINLSSPFAEAQIDALLAQADKQQRWFMSDSVSNFVTDRADPNVENIDNVDYITSQGVRTMSGDFLTASAQLASKLNGNNCVDMSVYLIDEENGISGMVTRDLFLDPIRLERNSFGKIVMATEGSVFKVSYTTTWQKSVKDGDLRTLSFTDHQTDLLNKKGLVDVESRFAASVSATTANVTFAISNGNAYGKPFAGLVFGDFVAHNTTTDLAVAVTAAVENPDGTYLVTFAAQTTNDGGTISATSTGYEFEAAEITYL